MKLLIFGATGSIGRHLVEQALEQGHTVTAFARHPTKLDIQSVNLKLVLGDALDFPSVQRAVLGQEAVLCSLGSGQQRQGNLRSQGTRNIVCAMEQANVRRLVCQTTLGAGDSYGNLNFFWQYLMFGILLREVLADHERQEQSVKQSQLDWIIVRPAAFTDGLPTGAYRHGFPVTDKRLKLKIARADVADFMVKQLTDDAYLHKTPGLSY